MQLTITSDFRVISLGMTTALVLFVVLAVLKHRDKRQVQAYRARALAYPEEVAACWAEGPDGDGYHRLRLQFVDGAVVTVSGHFDLDRVAASFMSAGISVEDRRVPEPVADPTSQEN